MAHTTDTLETRFWQKVHKAGPDECWEWRGSKHPKGYGRIKNNGKHNGTRAAHRLSYELHYGSIPDGTMVCHHCDNPSCVNPKHLFLGDNAANMRDMYSKGRRVVTIGEIGRANPRRGEENGIAKLTEADVRIILSSKGSRAELAQRFAVSADTIGLVKARKVWGHVDAPHVPLTKQPNCLPGENSPRASLTNKDASDIRRQLLAGISGAHLARQYGVSQTCISKIKLGKTYPE